MFIFLILCLAFTLLTMENYIISGFQSQKHRLLPLILGLMGLYNFYTLVDYLSGGTDALTYLVDLLLIQIVDIVFYYILDFMEVKLHLWQNFIIVTILISMDVFVLSHVESGSFAYRPFVIGFSIAMGVLISLLSVITSRKKRLSRTTKIEQHVAFMQLIFPIIALFLIHLKIVPSEIAMSTALFLMCIIVNYLMRTDKLRDVNSMLKEELFHTLDVPFILFDVDLFYIDASSTAKQLFENHITQMELHPEDYSWKNYLLNTIENGNRKIEFEKNGAFYCGTLQEAYYHKKKRGYIFSISDVTSQKRETEQAQELTKQKSDFLANMSHDLRSPLHAIIGGSEIVLSRKELSERNRVMVNHIHDAGENLLDIVNSILDFSKLETGKLELHPQAYQLQKLLEEQCQICFLNLKDTNVTFTLNIESDFPEMIYGDRLRVRQIIQNILSNAVKYTKEGSITCTVKVDKEDDRLRITYTVADTGIGMTKEQLENAFGDYVSYEKGANQESTGLGLSIVRQLSEAMGGYATATSEGGTTMTVVFYQDYVPGEPVEMHEHVCVSEYAQDDSSEAWTNTVSPDYVYPLAHVLLADDMAVNREIFQNLVEPWKFAVDVAENGKEAVSLAKENEYDLIFLDQMMPEMSGLEAAKEIQKISQTPLVLLTANTTEKMRSESVSYGFADYMPKPIDIGLLKKVIEKNLREDLRETPAFELDAKALKHTATEAYVNTLSTYVSELKSLQEPIRDYARNDIAMFRNKAHGIKGISKQFGKDRLAYSAEVMEMAAKTDNRAFIDDHFEEFYADLTLTIQSCERELATLSNVTELNADDNEGKKWLSGEAFKILLDRLKLAFESYELSEIEAVLSEMDQVLLSEHNKKVFARLMTLYEDMEYEEAAETVSEMTIEYENLK